jgi:serine O-acetyltransferase
MLQAAFVGGFFVFRHNLGGAIILFDDLRETIEAYKARDPAARSGLEVLMLYPGIKATRSHRKANWCYRHGFMFLARWISQRSRRKTGIEIHPGATVGKRLVIDHGMGIVIGETAEIGDDCLLYQGVTLGGTGKDKGKRHPTIGNNVLIGSGAKVLGPFKVGDNSRIASNAVVLTEIPPDSTAVGVPARVVRVAGKRVDYATEVDQVNVTDPVEIELAALREQVQLLENYVTKNIDTEETKESTK